MAARERAAATVTQRPADGKAVMMLAQIDARLGRKDEALANGHRALELLPPAKDAMDAPAMLEPLASIHAHVGETSRALDLLEELAKMTSPFVPLHLSLKLDEQWDPLRHEPRFAQLLESTAPRATK